MSDTIVQTLEQKWEEIVSAIPDDLEASAREEGALLRHRGFRKASDLLRVLLMYATLLSLRNTALWAACLGICALSRQALQQRILGSANWLCHLLAVQLTCLTAQPLQALPFIRRLILMDASVFARPGSPGTEWRLHLGWQPFHNQPAEVLLTGAHEGEGLDKLSLQEGDLVIADRAYGLWRHIQYALDALAFFLVRLSWCNLPLLTPDAQPFDLVSWLRSLPEATPVAEVTVLAAADPQRRPLRLVAGRLPPPKAQEARKRVRRQATKEKRSPHPNTLFTAGFCLLLTNLPAASVTPALVLTLYRLRWQIEWCFRRWKSLCHLGQLPAYPAAIAEVVLLAKLFLILLLHQHLDPLPWEAWWAAAEPAPVVSSLMQLAYASLCESIRPVAVLSKLFEDPTPFMRYLRSCRRKRPLQLAAAARCLLERLTGQSPLALAP